MEDINDKLALKLFNGFPLTSRLCQNYGTLFFKFLHIQGIAAEFDLATTFELASGIAEPLPVKIDHVTKMLNQHLNAKLNAHLMASGWAVNLPLEVTINMARDIMRPVEWKRTSSRRSASVVTPFGHVATTQDILCEFIGSADYQASLYEDRTVIKFAISGNLKVDARRLSRYRVSIIENLLHTKGFDFVCSNVEQKLLASSIENIDAQLAALPNAEHARVVLLTEDGVEDGGEL